MTIPVLILTWKRPREVSLLIDSLRSYKPSKLYIASDGPRKSSLDDSKLIHETRDLISCSIDWPCSVKHNYSSVHMGLKDRVISAISWFFSFEEMGAIFEEDCIPHPSFFVFAEQLLDYYKNDSRIFAINGSSFLPRPRHHADYYFSKYSHCWGWATWKRAWDKFDMNMIHLDDIINDRSSSSLFHSSAEERFWSKLFLSVKHLNKPNSWAIRWQYSCLFNNACIVTPNRNLVTNIGFNKDATHTKKGVIRPSFSAPKDIIHPYNYCTDKRADSHTFLAHYNGWFYYNPFFLFYIGLRFIFHRLQAIFTFFIS